MKKSSWNTVVDGLAFLAFLLLLSTGALVHFVLPAGTGRSARVWGLDRHAWGALHFWIALGMLALVALHLALHRRWVASVVRGRERAESPRRVALALAGLAAVAALVAAPLLAPVESLAGARGGGGAPEEEGRGAPSELEHLFDGRTTLAELERLSGVPAERLLARLGLPPDLPRDARLGRLRQERGLDMEALRAAVQAELDGR